ncbi:hypothetical protein Tco_1536725, partial [Tanacetum coccineum]
GSRTHKLKRLYKVGRSARVIFSDEASLGDQEDASKQGRKIIDIDKDAEITLVHETQGRYGNKEMFDTCVLNDDEVLAEPEVTIKDVNLSVDEVTLPQARAALKITAASTRPKAKGLVIHEEEQATTPTVSSQQPSHVKLQAEEEVEERLTREKSQREEEANIVAWDNVQAMRDADYPMAQQMQAEEQEKLIIKEKSKLFVQLLEARKKHFAAMRAQEKRNKPPTKAQKRNTMSTYLKNMAGYKHNQLKNKSFDDIKKLFDKAIKRQKLEEDKETAELQRLIEVIPDKEEVAIDAIHVETKPLSIVDYKIHKEGKKTYYQIIKADGSSKMYLVLSHMIKSFNWEDLETLWKLVKAKHG